MHDVRSIYLVPEMLREAGMDREVLTMLNLHDCVNQRAEDTARRKWVSFVEPLLAGKRKIRDHRRCREIYRRARCARLDRQGF